MIRITGEQQTQGITLVNTGRDCPQLLAKSYFQLLSLRQARKRVRRDRHQRVRAEKKSLQSRKRRAETAGQRCKVIAEQMQFHGISGVARVTAIAR